MADPALSILNSRRERGLPGVFAIDDIRSGSVNRGAAAVGDGARVVAALHSLPARAAAATPAPQPAPVPA